MRPARFSERAGLMLVQLRAITELPSDQYVKQQAWLNARLDACPLHPKGGCGLRKVGYYDRCRPEGLRVPRWHCRKGHSSISLLPDFAAVRVSSTLADIESAVDEVADWRAQGFGWEASAGLVRRDIQPAAALRWIRRRLHWVSTTLCVVMGLLPDVLAGCEPSLSSVRHALEVAGVLVRFREIAAPHLNQMHAPVGFLALPRSRPVAMSSDPHKSGPDPPRSTQ